LYRPESYDDMSGQQHYNSDRQQQYDEENDSFYYDDPHRRLDSRDRGGRYEKHLDDGQYGRRKNQKLDAIL
jgi:hypothetical protein